MTAELKKNLHKKKGSPMKCDVTFEMFVFLTNFLYFQLVYLFMFKLVLYLF